MDRKVCLDSDLLIDFLRGEQEAIDFVNAHPDLTTTQINLFELYLGAYKSAQRERNAAVVDKLVQRMRILRLNDAATKEAAKVLAELSARGNTIDVRDLFIGIIAKANGYAVKTNNRKDFERIPGLEIV